jgi:hypothetical protein
MLLLLLISTYILISSSEVIFVTEVARHGLRTPLVILPWAHDEIPSKLTPEGYDANVQLGKHIRKTYGHLLSQNYDPDEIYLRSTNFTRTIESLNGQVEGIYGAGVKANIQVYDLGQDYLLFPMKACPRIQYIMERDRLPSEHHSNIIQRALPYEDQIRKLHPADNIELKTLCEIGDVLLTYRDRGVPIPEFITPEVMNVTIDAYHRYHDKIVFGGKEQGKVGTFNLLNTISKQAQSAAKNMMLHKVAIYLTHDSVLTALLKMLGIYDSPPVPSASLFVEVHREDSRHFLKFIYDFQEREIPDCENECLLENFKEIVQSRTYKSEKAWLRMCSLVGDAKPGSMLPYGIAGYATLFIIVMYIYRENIPSFLRFKRKSN